MNTRRGFLQGAVATAILARASVATAARQPRIVVGPHPRAWGPGGATYELRPWDNELVRLSADGRVTWAYGQRDDHGTLNRPTALTVGRGGDLFVVDRGNHRVVVVSAAGRRLGYLEGGLHLPTDVALDAEGGVYVADPHHRRIRRYVDGRPARDLRLEDAQFARGLTVDDNGDLLVSDVGGVRRHAADGATTTFGGGRPAGLVARDGRCFVAQPLDRVVEVYEGSTLRARLPVDSHPTQVALAPDGSLYVHALSMGRSSPARA